MHLDRQIRVPVCADWVYLVWKCGVWSSCRQLRPADWICVRPVWCIGIFVVEYLIARRCCCNERKWPWVGCPWIGCRTILASAGGVSNRRDLRSEGLREGGRISVCAGVGLVAQQ